MTASVAIARVRAARTTWIVWLASGLFFLGLWSFRQPYYPAPWFDEGLNVSTAATLAQTGQYALPDSAGPRVFDPAIQTGPTVLAPVALSLRLFGIGIMQARAAMLPFVALALMTYLLVARRLLGGDGLLALLLLVIGNLEPYASFTYMSRQVLGEVPATGFILLGLLLWWRGLERHGHGQQNLMWAGLAWGLAMVTKPQIMLLLPAGVAVLAALDYIYYRQARWRAFIVPGIIAGGCVAAWYGAQFAILGPAQFENNAAILRQGAALHIIGLDAVHVRHALGVLWRSGWWAWGLPGIAWGLWQARRRTWQGFCHAAALALPLVALAWFVLFSVGWGRYAFYTLVLSPLWTAGLLADVWRRRERLKVNLTWRRWIAGALVTAYVGVLGRPLVSNLIAPVDTGYLAMRDYLAAKVPANAVIESWEWEMSLEAKQSIHHPTTAVTNLITDYMADDRRPPAKVYDARQAQPAYILVGAFGGWTSIYCAATGSRPECAGQAPAADDVVSFGSYALYRLRP